MSDWTQADYEKCYSPVKARVPISHPEYGNVFTYGWKYFAYGSRRAIDGNSEELGYLDSYHWLTSFLNRNLYTNGSKTLIVGCGIGATVYRILQSFSNASIWGADSSSYIHSIKDVDAPAGFDSSLILNINITDSDALTQLKPFTGGNGKVKTVVCELVTETIPIADRPAWFAACEALLSNNGIVVHLVMSNRDASAAPSDWTAAGWTWQSIADWGLEYPSHYFIDASDTSLAHVPT